MHNRFLGIRPPDGAGHPQKGRGKLKRPVQAKNNSNRNSSGGKKREDLDPSGSALKGLPGVFETLLRRFKLAVHLLTLIPFYGLGCVAVGTAIIPGIVLFSKVREFTQTAPTFIQYFSTGIALAFGFFLYGLSSIVILPTLNFLLRTSLKPWRGPYFSFPTVKWYIHNGLTYILRYTFLPFITPSPLNHVFYRGMGMKIGKGSFINTEFISDPSLIEVGEKVTIGGSVTIIAHYGTGGYLIFSPVKIGNGVTIGIRATIMAGVTIGENARVLPNSVVLPNTQIPAGETWAGVPAQKVESSSSR